MSGCAAPSLVPKLRLGTRQLLVFTAVCGYDGAGAHSCQHSIEVTLSYSPFILLASDAWPNSLDSLAVALFVAAAVVAPALGYAFMVLDFRAYLRSLRRALMRVAFYVPELPQWAQHETPRCVAAFGLRIPCNEKALKRAYLRKVKDLHPDRGGDRRRFMILQGHFEAAQAVIQGSAG